jgi:hypothetical protein
VSALLPLFGALIAGHALCDYPLQGDFLARAKNRAAPLPGVPWYQALGSHAIIHGGAVALLTGIPLLGLAEAALHAFIDDLKCTGRIGFNTDQFLHVACKAAWAIVAVAVLP